MKIQNLKFGAKMGVIGAILTCAASIHAATAPATLPTATSGEEGQFQYVRRGPEGEKLREAYQIMCWADHDYHGHRAKAMHETEEAGKRFGLDLHGEGRGHQRQHVSDSEMRHARELLKEVRDMSDHQKRVHEHVDEAIREIDRALEEK